MKTRVYSITKKIETELEGELRWITVLDTTIPNLWLRKYTDAGVYINETIGTALGLASFSFDIEEGNYQMWKSARPDESAGNRIDLYHGGATKYKYEVDESLPYMKKITDTSGTYWEGESLEVRSSFPWSLANNYEGNNSLVSKGFTDAAYLTYGQALLSFFTETEINAMLATINANFTNFVDKRNLALDQDIYSQVYFRGVKIPYSMTAPTNVNHITNKGWVESYVTGRINAIPPAGGGGSQQSANIVRVIPSGIQETNKVYRTLSAAITNATFYASATQQKIIEIQGEGIGGQDALYNYLPTAAANPYIDIIGSSPGIPILIDEALYTGTAGTDIMANLTFDNQNANAFTQFSNRTFYNCKFTNSYNPALASYEFVNCIFHECSTNTVNNTYGTTCKGSIFNLNTRSPELRQLGRYSGLEVAAALTIDLPSIGNYSRITAGTGTINKINSAGWTAGTQIILYFAGNVTITNASAASGTNLGVRFKDNASHTYGGGQYLVLILTDLMDYWRELIAY